MKSLTEFIRESLLLEALILFKPTAKTAQAAANVEDAIKAFINNSGKKYSINSKTDVKQVYDDFLRYCAKGPNTRGVKSETLKEVGITDGKELLNLIANHADELEKDKVDINKFFKMTQLEKDYKAWTKSDDYSKGEKFNPEDADESEDELRRTLLIYNAKDPGNTDEIRKYDFYGKMGKSTSHQVNMRKMDWKYETGLNYYDARPILEYNYRKKSKEELEKVEFIDDNNFLD